jgi:hypothetical protein
MRNYLDTHRPPVNGLVTRTRRWAIAAAAVPLLAAVAGCAHSAAPADSGLAACTALPSTHPVAASGYRTIGAQFARSRWPGLCCRG